MSVRSASSGPVLLLVPPLLKYLAGPLLGPAQLTAVGRRAGVPVRVLDFNAAWLRRFPVGPGVASGVRGDHARPAAGFRAAVEAWEGEVRLAFGPQPGRVSRGAANPYSALHFEHEEVLAAAGRLAAGALGGLAERALVGPRPPFVGVSVLWSGQVLAGLALTCLVKRRWPGVPVIWGGAHVAALAPEIAADATYGQAIDGFVSGYAEETFRLMLQGDPLAAPGVFQAGETATQALELRDVAPWFSSLRPYGVPRLTLPVQTSRGCAYGRCAFCTYPVIEGTSRELDLRPLRSITALAARLGADVAMKDAFITIPRLDAIAGVIGGRAPWAACTRLVPRLGRERLVRLVRSGLRTLEIGVESFSAETLRRLDKRQPVARVDDLLEDAAGLDLHLVLNVMAGFPGQTLSEAEAEAAYVLDVLPRRFPRTRFHAETNLLEVERRSLIAKDPAHFGVVRGRAWPWSSVLEWDAPEWRTSFDFHAFRREAA